MSSPTLQPNAHGLGLAEVQSSREASRRRFLYRTLLGVGALAVGIKLKDSFDNQSELSSTKKLVIPDINKLKLESGEQLTRENKPSYLLERAGIRPNKDGSYTLLYEDLAKSNIVVKFPDVSAPVPRAENKYLHIKISGIDFVTSEGNFSVVDK